jgi:uncharacterized protein Yka (UPF0111/DUF47 family)
MQKGAAVAALGQRRLMLPGWVKAALSANDRIKVYLTVLQTAWSHASHPTRDMPDLTKEIAGASLDSAWLHDLAANATKNGGDLLVPDLPRIVKCLEDDLRTMARPVLEVVTVGAEPNARVKQWLDWLAKLPANHLSDQQMEALTQGRREGPDSVHLLVMDLHKQINQLSSDLATEVIDGAKVWELQPADRGRVVAFMRGLNRTAYLKFDHPGLDTAATRDGDRLLIQNDIGTNDAHVLVLQVTIHAISLTYSDLHRKRLEFFQSLLAPFGAQWSGLESRVDAHLNAGNAYSVATAQFDCPDEHALEVALEAVGSRIVFLIDWNHARKRLQAFVSKDNAIGVLAEAARTDIGHRAWVQVGGERLIYAAMQAAGEGAFRIGDRLDEVLGAADARAFLLAVMRLGRDALQGGQPAALVGDETRMLLAQHVRHRTSEFDLLADHAAYCQSLAQAISDGLAHGVEGAGKAAKELSTRAKVWERQADHLVMRAREAAVRWPRWKTIARLAEQSDNVADTLEEAAFLISLIADQHSKGWNTDLREVLGSLAATVLGATQDQVKALAIARTLGSQSDALDNDAFLAATWRILSAERRCDTLLRDARRLILGTISDAPSLMLANDFASALELTSDHLLTAAYALREVAFESTGVAA